MLNNLLIQLFFGAPAGVISLLISALGIWKKWPIALILAAVWTVPATDYLSGSYHVPFYLISLLQLAGAYAVNNKNPRIAWYLLIPLLLFTVFMLYLTALSVFTQP